MIHFKKEQYKTVLLILLFFTSIALMQQLWMDMPLMHLIYSKPAANMEPKHQGSIVNSDDVISPQSITINFGGGLHTVFYADTYGIWKKVLQILQNNYFLENVDVQEIEKEEWIKANNVKSIGLDFACQLPMEILNKGEQGSFKDKISFADYILVSLIEEGSAYIANIKEGKYYRFHSSQSIHENLIETVDNIELEECTYYYPIEDIYGVSNYRLMPVEQTEYIEEISTASEIDAANDLQVESFAGTFFGENFDFVKKIRETTGSVIYMYGYGQKNLKINSSGIVEYIEEIDPQKVTNYTEAWDALQIAFQFVQEHGGWILKEGDSVQPFIKSINQIEKDKKKGYHFIFGYRLNGLPVYYSGKMAGEPLEIKVIGKQVIYYRRFLKEKVTKTIYTKSLRSGETLEMMSITDIIDKNFDTIQADYLNIKGKNDKKNEEKIKSEILTSIGSVKLGYYDRGFEKFTKWVPIWVLKMDKMIYYFDVYNGEILNRF